LVDIDIWLLEKSKPQMILKNNQNFEFLLFLLWKNKKNKKVQI